MPKLFRYGELIWVLLDFSSGCGRCSLVFDANAVFQLCEVWIVVTSFRHMMRSVPRRVTMSGLKQAFVTYVADSCVSALLIMQAVTWLQGEHPL